MANKNGMAQADVSVAALPCSKQRLPNTPLFNAPLVLGLNDTITCATRSTVNQLSDRSLELRNNWRICKGVSGSPL